MIIKKKFKILISIGIILAMTILVLFAYTPVFRTGTLKIKYISDETNTGNNNDGINRSGNIIIYIDEILKGTYPADQYITFSWFNTGKHTIDIWNGPRGFQMPGQVIASKDATVKVLETTTIDLHYRDGLF